MYYLEKTIEIAGSHHLNLDYPSKCSNDHGHNWIVTVFCKAKDLDRNGMVVDFSYINSVVKDKYDHHALNEISPFNTINPTAENIARTICSNIPFCYRVRVQESSGNIIEYCVDEEHVCHCNKEGK